MSTLTNYQSYKCNAYAEVVVNGETIDLDITNFHLSFAVNSIPTGTAQIVLGRRVNDDLLSNLHHIVSELRIAVPVRIYLKVTPGPNSYGFAFESWPSGYFFVFDGTITSTGYTRTRDRVGFNIGMTHWLADLASSCALTRSTHALTPQQLSGLAAFGLGQGAAGGFFPAAIADQFFTPDRVQNDFWGECLAPWLKEICQQDILSDEDDVNLGHNLEGLAALNRFEPFVYADPNIPDDQGLYIYGTPMALPIDGLAGVESLATAIAEDVGSDTFESFASSTLWDKLVGSYAASYDFRVIPLINSALIAPQIAGQRAPWQTIFAEEYAAIDIRAQLARPVKGVRLFTGVGSMTGVMRPGEAGNPPVLGGIYDNPDFEDGQIIYGNAPRWSANVAAPAAFGPGAAAPGGIRGGAIFPGAGAAPNMPNPADIINAAGTLWDLYARAMYIREALRGRVGPLQGKLRFDIAPGSTVMIVGVEDRFVRQRLSAANNLIFAEVQAVSISVDVEAESASTAFQLANVRTFAENERDATSIPQHPLYANAWVGAPLVELPEFVPQSNLVFRLD